MAVLQISNIHKSYGPLTVLDDATATFTTEQKIGFIGRNGAGKSTLCKIIIGQEEPDAGKVTRSSDLRLAYLEQHDPYKVDETVADFLMRYTGKEEWQCGEMAGRFHLKYDVLHSPIGRLAGGYRTRVKLAAMLLQDPNYLILDEPTNYLDLSTLILLENFLQDFAGGFMIVSHDREFLKRTCDHTLELERGRINVYPGSVEDYFEFKEEQLQHKLAHKKTMEKKKEQLQDFIDRFRAKAATAARAKSKMKQLARLKTISIDHPMGTVTMRIPPIEPKGGVGLICDDMSIGYADKTIASRINLEIERGQHVAILGDNGQGKTTFMRTVSGDLAPKSGSFRWGSNLKIATYAQHVFQSLVPQDDVFTHLQRSAAKEVKQQDILDMAGAFLFKGDDVKKKVSVLSGGERARLLLAGLLLTKSQVLLLDEPTNHLDFETVEALGRALKSFAGTIFFISHDRTFVNLIATNIIEIKNGRVLKYPGKYEDYVYHLEQVARGEEEDDDEADGLDKDRAESKSDAPKPKKHEEKKGPDPEIQKLQTQVTKSENRIKQLNKEKAALVKEIEDNPLHFSRDRNARIKELTVLIEEEEKRWMDAGSKLEKLKTAS